MKIKLTHIIPTLALAVLTTSANAAIVINGTAFWAQNSATVTGTFNASTSDKLVVVVTGEHGNPGFVGDVTALTYNGQTLIKAVNRDAVPGPGVNNSTDQTFNDIWYLDNPGNFTGLNTITATVGTRATVTVFGLTGTLAGVGATSVSAAASRSVNLTTTAANSLVITSFGLGGNGNTGSVTGVTADSPLTLRSAQIVGSNWNGQVTGSSLVALAGSGTYSFSGGNAAGANM